MITEIKITDTILIYTKQYFESWVQGDKSVIPLFVDVPNAVANMPRYHFFEAFTLRHYHENHGWKGFWLYALGPQLQGSESRRPNRLKVEEIIPAGDLQRFRRLQAADPVLRSGTGEPDLFLYKDNGDFMFVEVKKGGDRLSEAQFRCIAMILAVLRCSVDIVYVREEGQKYPPKTHRFNLAPFLNPVSNQEN